MCVEFCWCLCIHKVSFRGACYFFASVHSYDGVRRLLNLVFTNILLQTYFMDSKKTDLDMPNIHEDTVQLLAKSLYYLATTAMGLLLFRAVDKEWRQLMQWAGVIFLTIEAIAVGMYFVLHPESYSSANCIATLSARAVFVFFYTVSLILYIHQLRHEEAESEWKFQQSEWEPRFLGVPGGRSPGGPIGGMGGFNMMGLGGLGGLSGFGSLGFGENTIKWLEAEKVIPHPQLIMDSNGNATTNVNVGDIITGSKLLSSTTANNNKCANVINNCPDGGNDGGKFEVRYEVCKSSGKH